MLIDPEFVHTWYCGTANRFGLRARAAILNSTGEEVSLGLAIFNADGREVWRGRDLTRIEHTARHALDLSALIEAHGEGLDSEYLCRFSLVPQRFASANGPISIEPKELFALAYRQDHYIEFYDPKSMFASGVNYSGGPCNCPMLASGFSFLQQAPKVFLSEHRNTAFQLLFGCSGPVVNEQATVYCTVRAESGSVIATWEERAKANSSTWIDVKEALARKEIDFRKAVNRHGFLFFEGFSAQAAFVSLTMNYNTLHRTFDLEHTLPPVYYELGIEGRARHELISWYRAQHAQPLGQRGVGE